MTQAVTQGAHHIGLAVRDLDETQDFFCSILGFRIVGGKPDYPAVFVSDGTILLTLWRVSDPDTAVAFDRTRNVGLHHLALRVANEAILDQIYERVRTHPGVQMEFTPRPINAESVARHFICLIPGGIRLELATPFA
ncbi:MAG: VOC family protein [Rhodospirillum sp.]|nr:VOC family protein [Rhodospirillum sp.]MCF8487649.1 VOC family protein [Rhodospirillum sp.]